MSVVSIGELLIDCWPDGRKHPGGAPANVACHAKALGVPSCLISRVGTDESGARLRQWLTSRGVDAGFCQTDARHPTGTVRVETPPSGSPVYDIAAPAAWDFLEATGPAVEAAGRAKVFIFGTLAQRHPVGRQALRLLVRAAREGGARLLADLNLRAPFYDDETVLWTLRHCDALKLNREELAEVSRLIGAAGGELDLFTGLLREFGIARGVLTAGGDGAWICEKGALTYEPAVSGVEVVDPVGAGDAFTAVLTCGLSRGLSLRESAPSAARLAAWVVSCRGATPAWTPEMRSLLDD